MLLPTGGALHDDPNDGCERDYMYTGKAKKKQIQITFLTKFNPLHIMKFSQHKPPF